MQSPPHLQPNQPILPKDQWLDLSKKPVSPTAATLREAVLVMGVLALLFAALLALAHAVPLYGRNFWMDETSTYVLVTDPDIKHSLWSNAGGMDTNPPSLFLLLRAFTLLSRSTGEAAFRCFATLSVLAALLAAYLLLRAVYSPLTAFTATLVVLVHPLVLEHSFQARFYGPWLAAILWFSYALVRCRDSSPKLWPRILLGVTSLLVCTIHYFGIITLGLVVCVELLFHPALRSLRRPELWLTGLGLVGLAACLPFYFGQKAAFNIPTWVQDPDLDGINTLLSSVLLPRGLAVILVVAWFSQLACRIGKVPGKRLPSLAVGDPAELAGLTSLALLPLVLILFSHAVLSVMVDRYFMVAVAALAPITAPVVARTPRLGQCVLCGVLFLLGAYDLSAYRKNMEEGTTQNAELIDSIRSLTWEEPVFFQSNACHQLLLIHLYAPEIAQRCFMIDFEQTEIPSAKPADLIGRNSMRVYAKYYSWPALMTWEEVRNLSKIYVVGEVTAPEERYPGFTVHPLKDNLLCELIPDPPKP